MDIVHVFQEDGERERQGHLEEWFGCEPPSGKPVDAVCACGARMTILNKEGTVAGVYHQLFWTPEGW